MERLIQRFWRIADHPPSGPACFVIPSYALTNRTRPTRPTRAQIELAVAWWRRFPQSKLIMSTGDNQGLGISNATVMADYAESLGLPRNQIIEEARSRTTVENLRCSMQIIREENLSRPTLVTLDLYTRRAVATARKQGWQDFYWLSAYSAGEPAYGYKWLQTHSRFTIFCYEVGALTLSKILGWA